MKMSVIVLAALIAPATALAGPARLAYYTGAASDPSLTANVSSLSIVAADLYAISQSGKLTGSVPSNLATITANDAVALYPVVSNYGVDDFDPAVAHAIVKTGSTQTTAIGNMIALAQKSGVAGINLDFEALPNGDRSLMSAFVRKLADGLHAKSRKLIVSVPATTSNDPKDSWTGGFDYAAIGSAADIVQVMTYDQNGPWDVDGPVAGLNWVKLCINYAVSAIPKSKVSMGVPAYGYDYDLTDGGGAQIDWSNIPALIASTKATPQWDTASSSPKFYYSVNGRDHVVWYENPRSIKLKAQYAAASGVASTSTWSLGQEDQSFWSAMGNGGS